MYIRKRPCFRGRRRTHARGKSMEQDEQLLLRTVRLRQSQWGEELEGVSLALVQKLKKAQDKREHMLCSTEEAQADGKTQNQASAVMMTFGIQLC